jgi:hypothetical protein
MAGTFQFRWGVFVAAFALGMLYVYISEPAFQVVVKYPTPYDCDSIVYNALRGGCYKFSAKEVECTRAAVATPVAA